MSADRPTLAAGLARALLTGEGLAGLRLAAVFPHPDDESWAAGGLLARGVAQGAAVRLFTLSRGEAGRDEEPGPSPGHVRATGAALAAKRGAELGRACEALGLPAPTLLDLPDGAIELDAAVAALAPGLHAFGPELVVTFDHDGGYGHRDHTACVEATLRAAPPSAPVLGVALPRNLLDPLRRAFVKRRPDLVDPRYRTAPLGAPADLELTLTPAEAAAKEAAVGAHRSQLRHDGVLGFLGPGVMSKLLVREGYRWLRGGA